jgi:tetratricopeptide (TPR) repeat protein
MWDQAAMYYEKAVELEPHNPDVITDLGTCYRGMKQFDKALETFDRAHKLDPNHYQSVFNAAVVAGFDLKQFDRAEEALNAMESMNPPPPRLDELRQAIARERAAAGGGGAS